MMFLKIEKQLSFLFKKRDLLNPALRPMKQTTLCPQNLVAGKSQKPCPDQPELCQFQSWLYHTSRMVEGKPSLCASVSPL